MLIGFRFYAVLLFVISICCSMACSRHRPYMRTGFYMLSDASKGESVQKYRTSEFYFLNRTPFAGSEHIQKAYLQRDTISDRVVTELNMEYDSIGTIELMKMTGNKAYPQLAVIVANRLIYVFENEQKIITGKMRIILEGYEDRELTGMLNSVQHGK